MKKKQSNPLINQKLDREEQALEQALESGEYESIGSLEETKEMLTDAARRYQELNTTNY